MFCESSLSKKDKMIMSDPEFNIKFVQTVKNYPAIYNSLPEKYANKDDIEKAWNAIAIELNESATALSEKWKILRGGYCRHMRTKNPSKKPYYLAKYMEFLNPYLKSRPQRRKHQAETPETIEDGLDHSLGDDEDNNLYPGITDTDIEANDIDEEDLDIDTFENVFSNSNFSVTTTTSNNKKPVVESLDTLDSAFNNINSNNFQNTTKKPAESVKRRLDDEEDPDALFFRMLLPDVRDLDDKKRHEFRIAVLNLLNDLKYAETTVTSRVSFDPTSTSTTFFIN